MRSASRFSRSHPNGVARRDVEGMSPQVAPGRMASKSKQPTSPAFPRGLAAAILAAGIFLTPFPPPLAARCAPRSGAQEQGLRDRGLKAQTPDTPVAAHLTAANSTSKEVGQRLSEKDRRDIFETVWKEIRDRYYDPAFNGVDWNEVRARYAPRVQNASTDNDFYALMGQMTGELHDAHTRFSSPEQWTNFRKQQGVSAGFSVDDIGGKTVVIGVRNFSSAAQAGIEPGMVLVSVDGEPVDERMAAIEKSRPFSSSDRATRLIVYSRLLSGPPDSPLHVEFQRADGSKFAATLRRQLQSVVPDVTAYPLHSGVAYIRFDGFQKPVVKQFREALERFRNAPGVVIDLRRNGGGDLAVLLPIAGYFFEEKTLFAKDATRSGKPLTGFAGLWKLPMELFVGKPGERIYAGPVVILVDARSASSSEVFAAGMQDSRRAKIVGSQTCGCVLGIARPKILKGGAALEISEVLWFSPKGRRLEGTGILPDEVISPTVADLQQKRDPVVEAADRTLRELAANSQP